MMSRITKKQIIEQIIDDGSISTPILNMYFKRVHIGMFFKEDIDKARRKMFQA